MRPASGLVGKSAAAPPGADAAAVLFPQRSEFQAVLRGGAEIPGTARRREAITRRPFSSPSPTTIKESSFVCRAKGFSLLI